MTLPFRNFFIFLTELGLSTKKKFNFSSINLNAVLRQSGIFWPLTMEKEHTIILADVLKMRQE